MDTTRATLAYLPQKNERSDQITDWKHTDAFGTGQKYNCQSLEKIFVFLDLIIDAPKKSTKKISIYNPVEPQKHRTFQYIQPIPRVRYIIMRIGDRFRRHAVDILNDRFVTSAGELVLRLLVLTFDTEHQHLCEWDS